MMDYKEVADIIKKRLREENEYKRRRAERIKRISFTISGICAVAIVGIGIWSNRAINDLIPKTDNTIIEESEVNTLQTVSTSVSVTSFSTTKNITQTAVQKTNKTTTVQTQQTTKPQQTEISKIQTTAVTTAVNPPVQATVTEETADKPLELVSFESGTVKPYSHAPVNILPKDMPTVILDGREVKHKNVNNCDDVEIVFRVGIMDFGLERFMNHGSIYYSEYDEYNLDSYESGTDTKYYYDIVTDTVYSVDITYYRIPDYLGAYYYAVKFPNSEQIHLYRFYKDLYYNIEKNKYYEVFDKSTKYICLSHEDDEFFNHFEKIDYRGLEWKLDGVYCNYSEMTDYSELDYNSFRKFYEDENILFDSEECMIFHLKELNNAIAVRFGYDDVCYLYRLN